MSQHDEGIGKASLPEGPHPPQDTCKLPPMGWACARRSGHEGPCAAVPTMAFSEAWTQRNNQSPEGLDRLRALVGTWRSSPSAHYRHAADQLDAALAQMGERTPAATSRPSLGPKFEWCADCDGCGWCEGSPAWKCKTCDGTGRISIVAPADAPATEDETPEKRASREQAEAQAVLDALNKAVPPAPVAAPDEKLHDVIVSVEGFGMRATKYSERDVVPYLRELLTLRTQHAEAERLLKLAAEHGVPSSCDQYVYEGGPEPDDLTGTACRVCDVLFEAHELGPQIRAYLSKRGNE